MCTATNQGTIDHVIQEMIDQKRAFTAFEVSLEAKNRGANERHRHMKEYIHKCTVLNDACEFGDYTKTMVDVGNENGQVLRAFLYHPTSYDASGYQPLSRGRSQPVVTTSNPTIVAVLPASVPDTDNGDDSYGVDYRGRLWVLSNTLSNVGVKPSEPVYVFQDGNAILLSKTDPNQGAKAQIVEPRGGLHLSGATLKAYGLDGDKFLIENSTYNNETVVKITKK